MTLLLIVWGYYLIGSSRKMAASQKKKKPLKDELLLQGLSRGNFDSMEDPHRTPPFSGLTEKGDAEMKD